MADIIRAFSAHHVCRLTGLSRRQLSYWDHTNFFLPYYASEDRRSPFSRIYSFEDLVGLRVIAILRKEHQIPLQTLRRIAEQLSQYHSRPWSGLVLYVCGKEVFFQEPATERIREIEYPQYMIKVALDAVTTDMRSKADELRRRKEGQIGRLERHRNVVHNAWVVAGTRISTKTVWRYHQAGYDTPSIIREYPLLTSADISSAIAHERKLAGKAG
ncbi:DUF433 domain-containing protein [bacterium]|nr:DUF433 domain-containing protein [bacterium]